LFFFIGFFLNLLPGINKSDTDGQHEYDAQPFEPFHHVLLIGFICFNSVDEDFTGKVEPCVRKRTETGKIMMNRENRKEGGTGVSRPEPPSPGFSGSGRSSAGSRP
jgi:uncharacterized membrane protein YgcG